MCATSVPILVFLDLSVLELGPMYETDRRQTDANHRLMPYPKGVVIIWNLLPMWYMYVCRRKWKNQNHMISPCTGRCRGVSLSQPASTCLWHVSQTDGRTILMLRVQRLSTKLAASSFQCAPIKPYVSEVRYRQHLKPNDAFSRLRRSWTNNFGIGRAALTRQMISIYLGLHVGLHCQL